MKARRGNIESSEDIDSPNTQTALYKLEILRVELEDSTISTVYQGKHLAWKEKSIPILLVDTICSGFSGSTVLFARTLAILLV